MAKTKTRDIVPSTEITLGGKTYGLIFDMRAAYDFEQATGKRLLTFIRPLFDAFDKARLMVAQRVDLKTVGMSVYNDLEQSGAITAGDMIALFWSLLGGLDAEVTPKIRDEDKDAYNNALPGVDAMRMQAGLREAGRLLAFSGGTQGESLAGFWSAIQETIQAGAPQPEDAEEATDEEPEGEPKNA